MWSMWWDHKSQVKTDHSLEEAHRRESVQMSEMRKIVCVQVWSMETREDMWDWGRNGKIRETQNLLWTVWKIFLPSKLSCETRKGTQWNQRFQMRQMRKRLHFSPKPCTTHWRNPLRQEIVCVQRMWWNIWPKSNNEDSLFEAHKRTSFRVQALLWAIQSEFCSEEAHEENTPRGKDDVSHPQSLLYVCNFAHNKYTKDDFISNMKSFWSINLGRRKWKYF